MPSLLQGASRSGLQPLMLATASGTCSRASVARRTCSTVTPGAVSRSTSPASVGSMTASLGDDQVDPANRGQRQRAPLDQFGGAFGGVRHRDDDPSGAGHEIHRPAHSRHHDPRHQPVREMALFVHLQATEHRHVEMPAADQPERHRGVDRTGARPGTDRPAAGVGQIRPGKPFLGQRQHADQSVFGLKEHLHAVRQDGGRRASAGRCRGSRVGRHAVPARHGER